VEPDKIVVKGARQHNLKDLCLEIPKKKLVVFTGPSGSGKTSLAFDTLFAEGQRRYVESLSAYARQFLGQMEKPDYDYIRGLSPTISIEQKAASKNPRSTVGTITEIFDYLRVLYARVGRQTCYQCGRPVGRMDPSSIVKNILELEAGTKFILLAPLVQNRKGEFIDLLEDLRRRGFTRIRLAGEILDISGLEKLDKKYRHTLDVVVDRIKMKDGMAARLTDSVETALEVGDGRCLVYELESGEDTLYSERLACDHCGLSFPMLSPQSFSFNSPLGMCKTCNGLGISLQMDPDKVVRRELALDEGAIRVWSRRFTRRQRLNWRVIQALVSEAGAKMSDVWTALPQSLRDLLLNGEETARKLQVPGRSRLMHIAFEGALPYLMRRFHEAESESYREHFATYLSEAGCESCEGARLRPESRAVLVGGHGLVAVSRMTISEAHKTFTELELQGAEAQIAAELIKEIRNRLQFLVNVGLSYLTLDRSGPSLSGGEAQRIRLASQLGSELTGVLYILDEPSIGLHQRDNKRLLATLKHLRDLGNSVIIVEHDRETMEEADWILDFGPGAGRKGGEIVAQGTPAAIRASRKSITGRYLTGELQIEIPAVRRRAERGHIEIVGARMNNLKEITARIPIGLFTCVTGVSGAGKSTLVNEILYPALATRIYKSKRRVGAHDRIDGLELIDKVIDIDQSPIGRTPRSNPATYTKVFDHVRKLFALLPESRVYGFKPGRFSFNVKGGRCEACQGAGVRKIEMHFLPDVYVTCEECGGKRFNEATLRVSFKGYNISDVLNLSINKAADLFQNQRTTKRVLKTLQDVGLGYIRLGQSSTTLSGGEAQRVKLSRELAKVATGDTLYILDEPSTGLHFDDIVKLLEVIHTLVEAGNTVVMIEHNLDIIKTADHIIDLGPEGGAAGGYIVALGTPEEVAACEQSYTGIYLRDLLPSFERKRASA
jgi:excinuclease ABC subunit A